MARLPPDGMTGAPDFSVIVPTFERPQALARCLTALTTLDTRGPSFEVIVVDDGGAVDLDPFVLPARRRLPRFTLLRQEHAGPAAARNAGLAVANARWVAFTDDDCLPEPRWLVELGRAFAKHPGDGLGGRTVSASPTVFCSATQLLVDYVTQTADTAGPRFLASNNIAFPAATLRGIGGFDTSFPFAAGEDRDLCERWIAAGYGLRRVADAVIRHDHPMGLGRFCRMHYRYGRGARRLHRRRAARRDGRAHLEAPGFYAGLLFAPLSRATRRRAALCGAMALSQVCHAAGYAWEIGAEGRAASTTSRCQSSSASRFQR